MEICDIMTEAKNSDSTAIYVITRTGKREVLNLNKILKRLEKLQKKTPAIENINTHELTIKVCSGIHTGITTYEIDEYAGNTAASMSLSNPNFMQLATRIVIDNHQRQTQRSFIDKMRRAYLRKDSNGNIDPLLSEQFFKFTEEHADEIEAMINYKRDFKLDYFGFRTFQRLYAIKINGEIIERPQDMYMRAAIAINLSPSKHMKDTEYILKNIKKTYNALSNKQYTQASPTYFNAGTVHPQYSSCFLLGTGDSLEHIMETANDAAVISKWGGGIGIHCHCWRSSGALIRGTNGKSSGIVPFLRIYNNVMRAFNQGGKRLGSAAIYLMPHHPDIMKFLKLILPGGEDIERARDLFYALWIPDIFMERVKSNGVWSLFDPDSTGDLSNYHNEEYRKRYIQLEKDGAYTQQLPARNIWEAVYRANVQTGRPYIMFSDAVNRMSNQANLGTIKSSNLCVTGDTLILTDKGYFPIKDLTTHGRNFHNVWNGFRFSEAIFAKTGTVRSILKITFSDGSSISCTRYHKFMLQKHNELYNEEIAPAFVHAENLTVGDVLVQCRFPNIPIVKHDIVLTRRFVLKYLKKHGIRHLEPIDTYQISHRNKKFLIDIKLTCNTIGMSPILTRKRLPRNAGAKYIYNLNFVLEDLDILFKYEIVNYGNTQESKIRKLYVIDIKEVRGEYDTYCFNEPLRHAGVFNGILAGNCAEITEYSDNNESAVCNLCSVSLSACVKDDKFDFKQLINMVKLAVVNLDKIIDINFYPTIKTARSNKRHRPIGIGCQGLADTFIKLRMPFESIEAAELNKRISETMYYAALSQSTRICREGYQHYKAIAEEQGGITLNVYKPDDYNEHTATFTAETLPKNIYAYPSMTWGGGSPISKGIFHWELAGKTVEDLSGMYDWETLRNHIKTYGVRNSQLIALMPTASTSQLLGNNECFEPFTSNIYKRKTLAGEFIVINKYLINDLYRLKLYDENIRDYLIALEGSIQNICGIPEDLKQLYKTTWEISQFKLLDLAADRQPFVDQSQSLNLYVEDLTLATFTKLMFHAWRAGLKTGKYYMHTRPATMPQKFTLDPDKQQEMKELFNKEKKKIDTSFMEPKKAVCDLCSG